MKKTAYIKNDKRQNITVRKYLLAHCQSHLISSGANEKYIRKEGTIETAEKTWFQVGLVVRSSWTRGATKRPTIAGLFSF